MPKSVCRPGSGNFPSRQRGRGSSSNRIVTEKGLMSTGAGLIMPAMRSNRAILATSLWKGEWAVLAVAFMVMGSAEVSAKQFPFNADESRLEVFVPRAGLLSVLGHDHTIVASRFEGMLQFDAARPDATELSVVVPVEGLVVADAGVKAKTRGKIEADMRGPEVLQEEHHPFIQFHSSEIVLSSEDTLEVTGILTVAGISKTVSFSAAVDFPSEKSCTASGTVELEPEVFGIEPVTALGGAVKTASKIEIRFDVRGTVKGEGN